MQTKSTTILKMLLLLLSALGMSTSLKAGIEYGDGGDPTMMIAESARWNAINILQEVDLKSNQIDKDLVDWITPIRQNMISDLAKGIHKWTSDAEEHSTCARTNLPNEDRLVIKFSLPKCRASFTQAGLGEAKAIETLLHEAVHQAGKVNSNENEIFATRFAYQIYHFWKLQKERREPFWGELSFDNFNLSERIYPTFLSIRPNVNSQAGQIFLWGGCNTQTLPSRDQCSKSLNDGSIYQYDNLNPREGKWRPVASLNAPSGRQFHTASFASIKNNTDLAEGVVIFGGCLNDNEPCKEVKNDGSFYNLQNDTWHPIPSGSSRYKHSANWAIDRLYVFGGIDKPLTQSGSIVTPISSGLVLKANLSDQSKEVDFKWEPFEPKLAQKFEGRFGHFSVWTGDSLLVWGGCGELRLGRCSKPLSDGFLYTPNFEDPSKDVWTHIKAPAGFKDRELPAVVWTGSHLVVWGGKIGSTVLNDGARLSLAELSLADPKWETLPTIFPEHETGGRFDHRAVWDGSRQRVLYWGGKVSNSIGRESFAQSLMSLEFQGKDMKWKKIPLVGSPPATVGGALLGEFDMAITWGGLGADGQFTDKGFVFFP